MIGVVGIDRENMDLMVVVVCCSEAEYFGRSTNHFGKAGVSAPWVLGPFEQLVHAIF